VQNFAFKFQAVAEKTAKMLVGYFILPHLVYAVQVLNPENREFLRVSRVGSKSS